jgi:pSer/pThr/pTyr-binding forkhead associated (FHA) protein
MKYFKCGKCQTPYKFDENVINNSLITIKCNKCGANNTIRLGPVFIIQTKNQTKKINLSLGQNTIGRNSKNNESKIVLDDQFVSRKHVTIHVELVEQKMFFYLEDHASLNGTYNKTKTRLKPNLKYPFTKDDYFVIGLTKLSVNFN